MHDAKGFAKKNVAFLVELSEHIGTNGWIDDVREDLLKFFNTVVEENIRSFNIFLVGNEGIDQRFTPEWAQTSDPKQGRRNNWRTIAYEIQKLLPNSL